MIASPLLTKPESAAYLRRSVRWFERNAMKDLLALGYAHRVGGSYMFRKEWLDEFGARARPSARPGPPPYRIYERDGVAWIDVRSIPGVGRRRASLGVPYGDWPARTPSDEALSCAASAFLALARDQRDARHQQVGDSVVYYIQSGTDGPIKIGWSADPYLRLEAMQTGSPEPLRLLATEPGGALEERARHDEFAPDLYRGEWYRPSERLLRWIATVGKGCPLVGQDLRAAGAHVMAIADAVAVVGGYR